MKHIHEYLLSKNKNKVRDDKYYVILPGGAPYIELKTRYKNEVVHQYKLASYDYWILPASKLLDILKPFSANILNNKYHVDIWEVPEEYENDIERFKNEFENSTNYPETYLKQIDYEDIT